MGLTSSLQIGRSALTASQLAIQVTGNNLANATTPGYSRQTTQLAPLGDTREGSFFVGRGVQTLGITRQIDQTLQDRVWAGVSDEAKASVTLDILSQVESTLNELTDQDLSSGFSSFFNAWSELASSPEADGAKALVVREGVTLAATLSTLRDDLGDIRSQIDDQITSAVNRADQLLTQIADVNKAIVQAEGGIGKANSLRDQRDQLVTELSQYLDVTTIEQPSGMIDVLVGSTPIVLGSKSRGLEVEKRSATDGVEIVVRVKEDHEQLLDVGGKIGGLVDQRDDAVDGTIEQLDRLAGELIFQVNRIHSQGYSSQTLKEITGTQKVTSADTTRALNDPENTTFSDLPFSAANGGFLITVKNSATGATETVRIDVDLDGLDNTGAAGFDDDSSVASIAADISGVNNLTATVKPDGTISITAQTGYEFSFSEDTSGALAVLGINTYFTGKNARDIGVRQALQDKPETLNTGQMVGGERVDNAASLAVTDLQDLKNDTLDGQSIRGFWLDAVQNVGLRTDGAKTRADATTLVRENLDAQRQALSGVSTDEETINLIQQQQQYQGAARFISTINELTQVLLGLV